MSDLAASYKPDIIDLARLYAATNDKLGIYWLHVAAEDLNWQDRWQAIARSKLRDDFFRSLSPASPTALGTTMNPTLHASWPCMHVT